MGKIQIIQIVQKLCPEGVWGPKFRNTNGKLVLGLRPHTIFPTFIAQFWPPDPPPDTFFLYKFNIISFVCLFPCLFGGPPRCKLSGSLGVLRNICVRRGSGGRHCTIRVRRMCGAEGPTDFSYFYCATSAPRPPPHTISAQF